VLKREVREETRALSTEGGGGKRRWCWKKREERLLVMLRKVIALERAKRKERRKRKSERERERVEGGKESEGGGKERGERGRKRKRGREEEREIQDGASSRAAAEGSDEVRSRDERTEPLARSIERTKLPPMLCDGCADAGGGGGEWCSGTTPCRALATANESEYTTITTFTTIIVLCYATTSP